MARPEVTRPATTAPTPLPSENHNSPLNSQQIADKTAKEDGEPEYDEIRSRRRGYHRTKLSCGASNNRFRSKVEAPSQHKSVSSIDTSHHTSNLQGA